MTVQEVVDMLNEAVTLSPGLWSLFDVQIPCAPMVGRVTSIELMDTGLQHLAFANTIGMINGVIRNPNERVCIALENSGGRTTRKFAVYRTAPSERQDSLDRIISEVPKKEGGS